jgi:hypothetical protein
MASAGDLLKFKVSNSKIGKCICVYIILILFYRGLRPPLSPQPTAFFFQNRFLNLSLISRFPIYGDFRATVRGIRLSGGVLSPQQYPLPDYAL